MNKVARCTRVYRTLKYTVHYGLGARWSLNVAELPCAELWKVLKSIFKLLRKCFWACCARREWDNRNQRRRDWQRFGYDSDLCVEIESLSPFLVRRVYVYCVSFRYSPTVNELPTLHRRRKDMCIRETRRCYCALLRFSSLLQRRSSNALTETLNPFRDRFSNLHYFTYIYYYVLYIIYYFYCVCYFIVCVIILLWYMCI